MDTAGKTVSFLFSKQRKSNKTDAFCISAHVHWNVTGYANLKAKRH